MTRSLLVAGLVAASLLSACALPPPAPEVQESRDRVTASDESAASRRARVRLELAGAYFTQGQYTTALDEVKQALLADPTIGEAHNLRGLIYAALGDHGLAEESFRRALQLNPRDGDAMHNFAWYLCQNKRYGEAQSFFAQAVALPQYPGVVRSSMASGICQARAGQWDQAEATLTHAYELDPGNPVTAVNLSEVLVRRGSYERARFYMKRVNAVASQSNAQTLWLAARIEMKLGNRTAANEYGFQLRNRFPQSRESAAFDRGQFDE